MGHGGESPQARRRKAPPACAGQPRGQAMRSWRRVRLGPCPLARPPTRARARHRDGRRRDALPHRPARRRNQRPRELEVILASAPAGAAVVIACTPASPVLGRGPGCTFGTSRPGTQRSRAATSTTSTLSHPVLPRLPRLAARPREDLVLLHILLQRPTRKRPSPH
jgi:hypothetical protein